MVIKHLIFPERLSIGVSLNSGELSYALVYLDKTGMNYLVSSGQGIPLWLRYIIPLFAHTGLSTVPVIISKKDIGNEDPDDWIERQESGKDKDLPEDIKLISEYFVEKSTVYKVSISSNGMEEITKKIKDNCEILTLSAPLWSLAALYWDIMRKPFLLWKISRDGSVIGKVDNGRVEKICNFWPDILDINEKQEQVTYEITRLINSMCNEKIPVILFSPEKEIINSPILLNSELRIENPPEIKGVPEHDHENYALACQLNDKLNFLNYETVKTANLGRSVWEKTIVTTRFLIIFLLLCTVVLFGIEQGCNLYVHRNLESLSVVKEQMVNLKLTGIKLDSVITKFKEKAGYIAGESKITNLLSDLQSIFPEGLKAEEITVLDDSEKKYRIDIRAVASNSALIGAFMENLREIEDISECRMIYSEQMPANQGDKGIRIKIEAFWRN